LPRRSGAAGQIRASVVELHPCSLPCRASRPTNENRPDGRLRA
jgi:hypothetical protein